jgi:hypothetical protein
MDSQPRYAMVEKIIGRTGKKAILTKDLEVVLRKFKFASWMTRTESF